MGQSTLIVLKNFAEIKKRHDNIKNLKFTITNFLNFSWKKKFEIIFDSSIIEYKYNSFTNKR